MQMLNIFSLFLLALVACGAAQNCRGTPRNPSCTGPPNSGSRCRRRCRASTVWYYDAGARQCRQMRYTGRGGNNNRWCTRAICEQRCRR